MTARSWTRTLFARPARKAPARRRLAVEALEDRLVPVTFTVSRLADDAAAGSLRWAITQANTVAGNDLINFSVTGTINLAGRLPDLNSNLAIQGPGAGSLTVRRNTGGDYGIFTIPGFSTTVALSGLTIANGLVTGGIYNYGTLTVSNSTLSGNTAQFYGGGIRSHGTLTVSNSILSGNSATRGGGIYTERVTATVTNSTLSGNSAWENGGGITNYAGTLTLSNSTLSGNFVASDLSAGGGIYNSQGFLMVRNSTLSGNSANGVNGTGGGIAHYGGTLRVSNSTLSGNSAPWYGGGIYSSSQATLENSLVVNSPNGGNIVGDYGGSHYRLGSFPLGPLQLNGGPTPTHALLPGSPAFNAGSNALIPPGTTTDQRGPGFARVNGGTVDIGAFEGDLTPVIARDQAAVTADEGAQATNTGTFDDPQGRHTVTLTASVGTLTRNNTAGTWAWAYTPPDGPAGPTTVTVTATNNIGLNASTTFTLTVRNVAPTITALTVPAASKLGGPVALSAAATDPAGAADPLTFTWTITRPNLTTFTVTGAVASFTPAASGRYGVSLTVNDGDGGSTSLPATGLVSWWKGEGNASDVRGGNHGTLVGTVGYAAGLVGRAFSLDGGGRVEVADAPSLDLTGAATLEAWIKPSSLAFTNGFGPVVVKGTATARNYGLFVNSNGGLHLSYFTTGGTNVSLDTAAGLIPVGQFSHVAAVIDPAGGLMQIYRNGQLVASRAPGGRLVANAAALTIGSSDAATNFGFKGVIDEPTVYGRALTQQEVQSVVNVGGAGKLSWVSVLDGTAQTSLSLDGSGGGGAPAPGGGAPGAGAPLADRLRGPRSLPPNPADAGGLEAMAVAGRALLPRAGSDGYFTELARGAAGDLFTGLGDIPWVEELSTLAT